MQSEPLCTECGKSNCSCDEDIDKAKSPCSNCGHPIEQNIKNYKWYHFGIPEGQYYPELTWSCPVKGCNCNIPETHKRDNFFYHKPEVDKPSLSQNNKKEVRLSSHA